LTEFADIFDYQLSTMVFGYMSFGFVGIYGLIFAWGLLQSSDHSLEALPAT
jgi:hypothetical protein